jgi:hypothetical protein
MPSKSKAQHNFMAAVANNPSFAKKTGVPQSVGKEFSNADKNRKFSKGGDMKAEMMKKGGMPMKMKDGKKVPIFMNKGGVAASPMGKVKTAAPSKDGVAVKGKTKGTQVKMAGSGVPGGIGSKVMKNGGVAKSKKMAYGGKTC